MTYAEKPTEAQSLSTFFCSEAAPPFGCHWYQYAKVAAAIGFGFESSCRDSQLHQTSVTDEVDFPIYARSSGQLIKAMEHNAWHLSFSTHTHRSHHNISTSTPSPYRTVYKVGPQMLWLKTNVWLAVFCEISHHCSTNHRFRRRSKHISFSSGATQVNELPCGCLRDGAFLRLQTIQIDSSFSSTSMWNQTPFWYRCNLTGLSGRGRDDLEQVCKRQEGRLGVFGRQSDNLGHDGDMIWNGKKIPTINKGYRCPAAST